MRLRSWLVVAALVLVPALASAKERFAMAVYHFNLQYVAGGLSGYPDGNTHDPAFEFSEAQLEDAIIVESFEPLLDIYLRHPTWGADFELQGKMIDVLRERHPAVLAKVKTLATAGAVAFDSFHWSDQLWVAYPRRDQEVSFDLTKKSFEDAGVVLGKSVWTQEGQWGPGLPRFMAERGLEVAILPRNLVKWLQGDGPRAPLYTFGDRLCVVTTGASDELVDTGWTFVDDGELAVTNRVNPYFGVHFKYDEASAKKLEDDLAKMETDGTKLVSAQAYAKRAVELGVKPVALPQLTDGTWQPGDTGNVFRWMGGAGLLNAVGAEDDNGVLTRNARVGMNVRSAESVINTYAGQAPPAADLATLRTSLDKAWRELLLAQVSDATGWNPFIGERQYAENHANAADGIVNEIFSHPALADRAKRTEPRNANLAVPLFEIATAGSATRKPVATWKQRVGRNVWEVSLQFPEGSASDRFVGAEFPRSIDRIVTTFALEDRKIVDFPLDSITQPTPTFPLPVGLIGLGEDLFLVQVMETVHLCAAVPKGSKVVRFLDETAPTYGFFWNFLVVKGTAEAALAVTLAENVDPKWTLGEAGCACGPGNTWSFALIGVFATLLRRRRISA